MLFLVQKLRLSEEAHKMLSATKVEPLLRTLQSRAKFKNIFNLEKSMAKTHRDVLMAFRPVLKITRWDSFHLACLILSVILLQ